MSERLPRVSRNNPCRICGHTDYCGFSEDGKIAICMRIGDGSFKKTKNEGWLHFLSPDLPKPKPEPKRMPSKPIRDLNVLLAMMADKTKPSMLESLGKSLGVSATALSMIGTVWAHHDVYAFPMKDATGTIAGIRYRSDTGKWAETGWHEGIFYDDLCPEPTLCICEGPTDTAAAIDLGFKVIGRPSCGGCHEMIVEVAKGFGRAMIISDADTGKAASHTTPQNAKLQAMLTIPSCMFFPPCKDLRQFVQLGGNRLMIDDMLKNITWRNV